MLKIPTMRTVLIVLFLVIGFALPEAGAFKDWHCGLALEALFESNDRQSGKLTELFDNFTREEKQRKKYLQGSRHETVYITQVLQIKQLSEEMLDFPTTENFLAAIHVFFHRHFKNHPELGEIIYSNYKNHFVTTRSGLLEADFERQVLEPVQAMLAFWLSTNETGFSENQWAKWIQDNIKFASGASPEDAQFHLAKRLSGIQTREETFEEWRLKAVERRTIAKNVIEVRKIPWSVALISLHNFISRNQGGNEGLWQWLGKYNANVLLPIMSNYLNDLRIADFFAPSDEIYDGESLDEFTANRAVNPLAHQRATWEVEHEVALRNAKEASYVLITDIEGLGALVRLEQDHWIAEGAHKETLAHVYDRIRDRMQGAAEDIFSRIQELLGQSARITVYKGDGDELVWFLPSMNANELSQTMAIYDQRIFRGFVMHHSKLFAVQKQGGRNALNTAMLAAEQDLIDQKRIDQTEAKKAVESN